MLEISAPIQACDCSLGECKRQPNRSCSLAKAQSELNVFDAEPDEPKKPYDCRGRRTDVIRLGQVLKEQWGEKLQKGVTIKDYRDHYADFDYVIHHTNNRRTFVDFLDASHFTTTQAAMQDEIKIVTMQQSVKDDILVTIPYFVDLNNDTFKHYFGIDPFDFQNTLGSGFVNKDVLPCDFNSYGEDKFMDIFNLLPSGVQTQILDSLSRIQKHTEWSVFGQTLVFKELLRPATLRNFYQT
jgi:hypothetical protein